MNRFMPDTLWEAVMRFLAMAAPDANVYVEIAAPDLRFAIAVLVGLITVLLWRRLPKRRPVVLGLLGFVALAFIPWMETSGNGRYFVTMLLVIGPLVAGLIHLLPFTKSFRLFLMLGAVAAQSIVLVLNPPWGAWAWLNWDRAPYFQVSVPPAVGGEGVTYFTVSSISYSLIAPQFPAAARWISLASGGATPRDAEWTRQMIARDGRRVLVAPSVPQQTAQGQPTAEVREALDLILAPHSLALDPSEKCEVLPSRGLAAIVMHDPPPSQDAQSMAKFSFWLCPLRYPVPYHPPTSPPASQKVEHVFGKLESMCPRFFRPGESASQSVSGGMMRHYPGSDMKVYVLDNGQVWYKFWRALNPVLVGHVDDVLNGTATVQCDNIRGRAGLPWDREI